MEPTLEEIPLMEEIFDGIEDDHCDAVVDGWMRILGQRQQLWFEKLYKEDVEARNVVGSVDSENKGKRKGKVIEKESCFENLKDLIEAGLKGLSEEMTKMERKVYEKLEVLDKKVNYVMRYVPPMNEGTGMENVGSTDLEDDLSVEEVEGSGMQMGNLEKEKELGDLEKEKEADLDMQKEADMEKEKKNADLDKEKKKKAKKRKLSYSELVTGAFEPPTHSFSQDHFLNP